MMHKLECYLGELDAFVAPRKAALVKPLKSNILSTFYHAHYHSNTHIHQLQAQNHALTHQAIVMEQNHARIQRELVVKKDGLIDLLRDKLEAKRADNLQLKCANTDLTEKCEALESAAAADAAKSLVREAIHNIQTRGYKEQLEAMKRRAAAAEDSNVELLAKLSMLEAAYKQQDGRIAALRNQLAQAQEAGLKAMCNQLLADASTAKGLTTDQVDVATQTCSTDSTARQSPLPAINTHKLPASPAASSAGVPSTPELLAGGSLARPAAAAGGGDDSLASRASQAASMAVSGLLRTTSGGSSSSRSSSTPASPSLQHTQRSPTLTRPVNNRTYQTSQQQAPTESCSTITHHTSFSRKSNSRPSKGRGSAGCGRRSNGTSGSSSEGSSSGGFGNSQQGSSPRDHSPRIFTPRSFESTNGSSGYRAGYQGGRLSSSAGCSYGSYDGF